MSIDYYSETQNVISALMREGLVSEATSIRDVIAAGATASEILMGIRFKLQEIHRSKKVSNVETARHISSLIVELNKVLS